MALACSSGTGTNGNGNGTGATGSGTGATGNGTSGGGGTAASGGAGNGTGASGNGTGANGNGTGANGNGTGASGNAGAGGSCTSFEAGANAVPPVLLFLVDTSLSMNNPPSGTQGSSKWSQTRTALLNALDGFPDDWAVGLTYFPNAGISSSNCYNGQMQVPIAPLCDNRTALRNSLNSRSPNGGTPTPLAMNYALGHVTRPASSNSCPADYSSSALYVVLMTDGTPTYNLQCDGVTPIAASEYNAMITAVSNAAGRAAPVGTFVIGVPGSETCDPSGGGCCTGNNCGNNTYDPRTNLSRLATAGGTDALIHPNGCSNTGPTYCHMDLSASGANFGTALQSALGQIGSAVATCTYTVPQAPVGYVLLPGDVHVNYNGTEIPHQADAPAACSTGWQYNADQSQILLCGDTCDTVQADTQAQIRVWATCLQPG